MVKHLLLPKAAWTDVQTFLGLEESKLRVLDKLFATAESLAPRNPGFLQQVASQLQVQPDDAPSVVLVCNFLLAVVEEGAPPREIVSDLREFVVQHDTSASREVLAELDSKREVLETLLTPKPERSRARKIQALTDGPGLVAHSFRTICELRPVFDCPEGEETILGYASTILMEIRLSDQDGGEKTIMFHLSPESLETLGQVVDRTKVKLEKIRKKVGKELLNPVSTKQP